jgi:hypothetical protein
MPRSSKESAAAVELRKVEEKHFMASRKIYRAVLIAALLITGVIASPHRVLAQSEQSAQASARIKTDDATALEVQLYLIVGTKAPVTDEEKLPASRMAGDST